ncbi:gliding motility-associated C-terminal domain-containing protein [uncultured Lacinutrix sp.]|uniref:T9SS type B sorting domain-containing protein n=1 Tax=uncultured Lacinutrix sp. TaxID=574032 RepID=UPI0026205E83|nr:gliding motility-associated C-terminal domain-containing protein [uncultured Lacinutrix sp.]
MKKTTLLLTLTMLFLGLQVNAQITTFPYSEDFEAGDGGWTADNTTAGTWALGAPTGGIINSAASGANAWVTNLTGTYNANESSTVTSPVFDFSALNAPGIEFSIWWNSEFSWDGLVLQSSIDSGASWQNVGAVGDPNNWYTDGTINGNPGGQQEGWTGRNSSNNGSGAWVVARHNLIGLNTQANVILRFAFGSDGSVQDEGVAFDNITVFEVSCPEPTNLTFVSATSASANITWTAGGAETNWEVAVQPQGTGQPTGAGTATTTNAPYVAMGLTPATNYEVYVRSDCGGDFSPWIGPLNFITECVTFTAPYTEDFENAGTIPVCWAMSGGEDWQFNIAGPNHVGNNGVITGATASGNYYAVVDASGNDGPTILVSPLVDVTTLTTPALSFYEISDNEGNANSTLDVEVWDGAAWNPVGTYNTNTVGWELKVIDISTLTITGDVQARFTFSETVTGDFYDDIAIDDVTFDELPTCVVPGGINLTNIAGTSADLSWMAGGGETEWEYVVQTAGTGLPTGAGTATTTTTINLTGLTFETDYEVYVRSNCGANGFSDWAGPVNFTTTVQLNFTVDCAVGPQNFNYCYDNSDTNVFTFTSTDGTPLNFTINSGNVENNWDELVVFDTDGTTDLNAATPYGNNGDVSGITYQSTGDTISFTITSDGSVNCQGSATINPLDITVSCATCVNPVATYVVVDDCANGDQFLVDVDITSLGDAMSIGIQDNQGNPAVSVTTTGVVQFGPYPFLTDIIFTVSNEQDSNCIITSSAIQLAACPPDNDNCIDATVAVVNDSFICEMSTPGTLVEATDSGVPTGTCTGNPDDDVWYQFTALSEFQLIALANLAGSNTFNIDHALYEGTCGTLVELACTSNDLSSVTPQLVIGNTYFIRVFSGGGNPETTTFDLCITPYVAPTNIDCVTTENLCPGNGDLYTYNTIGITPGLGQIDCLFTSPNPTFSIMEIGSTGDIAIEMVQNTAFDAAGNPIGAQLDVDFALWGPFAPGEDFCGTGDFPSTPVVGCSYSAAPVENFTITGAIQGELYVVLITNFAQDPGIIQLNQTNISNPGAGTLSADIEAEIESPDAVFIDDDSDPSTPSVANLCGFDSITLNVNSPFADTYEWSPNCIFDPSLSGPSLTITESGCYSVTAYDDQCMGFATTTVIVNLYQEAIVDVVPADEITIVTCDDESGDGIEEFDFSGLSSIILSDPGQNPADFSVTYHETLNDAQTGMSAITFPYSATDGTIIYVRVEDVDSVGTGSGCASTNTSFTLSVLGALPTITGVQDLILCDDATRDGVEAFDLELNTPNILNGQDPTVFAVSYHTTLDDATMGVGALVSPYDNISNPQTIYARIENTAATDCFKTTSFDIIVNDIPVTSFTPDFDYEVCPNATVPIIVTATADNYMESNVTIAWYNEGVLVPGQTDLSIDNVLTAGTYTIEVMFNDTGCVSTEDIVIVELETCVIPQGISPNGDGLNETFDVSSYDVQNLKVFNRNGRLVYEKDNYTNEWHGQSQDGDELPVGTYYYVMNYQGNKTKAAWVYINRAN